MLFSVLILLVLLFLVCKIFLCLVGDFHQTCRVSLEADCAGQCQIHI